MKTHDAGTAAAEPKAMRRLRLTVAYDGQPWRGRRIEPGSLSRSLRQDREVLRREKGARLPLEKRKSIGRLGQPKR